MGREDTGREEVIRVEGKGSNVAMREGGEDIVIVPSDPNTSVSEGYVRVSFKIKGVVEVLVRGINLYLF